MGKTMITKVILSVGVAHPLYGKMVRAEITPCCGYNGLCVDATTTRKYTYKRSYINHENITAWADKVYDEVSGKWLNANDFSMIMRTHYTFVKAFIK